MAQLLPGGNVFRAARALFMTAASTSTTQHRSAAKHERSCHIRAAASLRSETHPSLLSLLTSIDGKLKVGTNPRLRAPDVQHQPGLTQENKQS